MPNWCNNNLSVVGPVAQIKKFKEQAKWEMKETDGTIHKGDFRLSSFIKMPKELDIGENWYNWNITNYGCKWDCDGELENDEIDFLGVEAQLDYWFDSPWGPPIIWLEKVSKKYMKLKFTMCYEEPGMGFKGEAFAEKGIVEDKELEYVPEFDE